MLKVAFISLLDPRDRRNFSGTLFYMLKSLESTPNVDVQIAGTNHFLRSQKKNLSNTLWNGLAGQFDFFKKLKVSIEEKALCAEVISDIASYQPDIIVAPVASRLIARLPNDTPPLAFITDATPTFVKEFYGWEVDAKAFDNEIATIKKAEWVIYSSDFMQHLAEEQYAQLAKDKAFTTIPFGLNLDNAPSTAIETPIEENSVKLLFVARFWERKGGDIVLDCLKHLVSQGIKAQLTIIGCDPQIEETLLSHVTIIPFLNKNEPDQQARYFDILSESHFFVLPTRADCTPMVIAEANAFSTPVLVSNVGGIPTLVDDGQNGFLFDLEDGGLQYADKVLKLTQDKQAYGALCKSSFDKYQSTLNWQAWAKSILSLLK